MDQDEANELMESLLENCEPLKLVMGLHAAVLKKEKYARENWGDRPETFEYYSRILPHMETFAGLMSTEDKDYKKELEERREAMKVGVTERRNAAIKAHEEAVSNSLDEAEKLFVGIDPAKAGLEDAVFERNGVPLSEEEVVQISSAIGNVIMTGRNIRLSKEIREKAEGIVKRFPWLSPE